MKDRYSREMDQLEPRQETLDKLYEMLEGECEMKHAKRFSSRAVAILVCAVLAITAAAAAPAVWGTLLSQLGVFAPYAQTIDGAVCQDQGIEVRVLSALSDDLEARVYFSVRDVEGDRLNEYLALRGQLEAEFTPKTEPEQSGGPRVSISTAPTRSFKLLSYDPESKTALFSASVYYGEDEPGQTAKLTLTGMTTQEVNLYAEISCAGVTSGTLESLPVGEEDRVIFRPSSIANSPYTDAVLPSRKVVLAPGQNPMPLEKTGDIWVSSIGFASDGCFHVRLGFGEGISVPLDESGEGQLYSDLFQDGEDDSRRYTFQATLVPGGVDILFPLIGTEDLELLQSSRVRVYGTCAQPGTELAGDWSAEFQLEHHRSVTLDWTGVLAGREVYQVTVSPLSVTMASGNQGEFANVPLYAVKRDGSTVVAEPGKGLYSNRAFGTGAEGPDWEAFNTWVLAEPVDPEELAALTLLGETIPVR